MSGLWVKAKPWAVLIACGWVLFVFIVLMERSSSHVFSKDGLFKIWRVFGDLVLLKGISKYQALIAGAATLCGGAFVVLAARQQIEFAKRDKIRESRVEINKVMTHHKQILSLLSVEFSIVANFLEQQSQDWHDRDLSWINQHATELVRFDPALLETIRRAQSLIQIALIKINGLDRNTSSYLLKMEYHKAAIIAYAAHDIFKKAPSLLTRDIQDGWFKNLDPTDIQKDMNRLFHVKEDLKDMRHYYRW